jgi:hypothetical protein
MGLTLASGWKGGNVFNRRAWRGKVSIQRRGAEIAEISAEKTQREGRMGIAGVRT